MKGTNTFNDFLNEKKNAVFNQILTSSFCFKKETTTFKIMFIEDLFNTKKHKIVYPVVLITLKGYDMTSKRN